MKTCENNGKDCPQGFSFSIGTDPEFSLASGRSARSAVSRNRYWNGRSNLSQPLGLDGCPTIFELRPEPAYCAHSLVANIGKAFEYQRNYFEHTHQEFIASPYHSFPCGGHLHFGIKGNPKLVNYLDAMLVPPIKAVFNESTWNRRARGSYGRLSDWRTNSWGFEYRTLPTFLAEKALALAVFSLAGAIIEYAIEQTANFPAVLPETLETFPKHPAFRKRWPEISYLTFLKQKGFLIRENKNLKETWLPQT